MSEGQLTKRVKNIEEYHFGGIPPKEVIEIINQAKAEFPKQLVGKKGPADNAGYWEDDVAAWVKKWLGTLLSSNESSEVKKQ